MSRVARPRSFERKVAFRTKPPGQPGRPRKHYPPVFRGRAYDAKLVLTTRAVYSDPESGKGEFAVVREPFGYRVWSCDEDLSDVLPVRRDALKRAAKLATAYDRDEADFLRRAIPAEVEVRMQAEIDRLNGLSNDEKIAHGRRLRSKYGTIWQGLENVLILHVDSPLVALEHRPFHQRAGSDLRRDVRAWLCDNGVHGKLWSIPFANARIGSHKVPVYCHAMSFEDPNHAVWFKLVWWGNDGA